MVGGDRPRRELGEEMFAGYPRFVPAARRAARSTRDGDASSGMPAIAGPDDWLALTTRLRVVLEDPRQLLSGAVTDYASRQLVDDDNTPSAVTVPGLDGEPYPGLAGEESSTMKVTGQLARRERGLALAASRPDGRCCGDSDSERREARRESTTRS